MALPRAFGRGSARVLRGLLCHQPRQPEQVVRRTSEHEGPVHFVQPAHLHLAQSRDLFQPAERLLHQPAPAQAGPVPSIAGLEITTAYYPAQEVGGDSFQIIPLPSGDTLLVIGDVAGKGVPAALTVSLIIGVLRTLADYVGGPGEILAGLNRRLYGRDTGFSTCLVMQFAADCKSLTIANAGHLSAYINLTEVATEVNLPLGMVQNGLNSSPGPARV